MIRQWVAAFVSAALPVAALCAPLVHAHVDDHDADHHAAAVVHAHVSAHVSRHHGDLAVTTHDDAHAIRLQVFVAVASASFDLPVAAPTAISLATPAEVAAHRPVHIVHGHDPPPLATRPSRAPPFLS